MLNKYGIKFIRTSLSEISINARTDRFLFYLTLNLKLGILFLPQPLESYDVIQQFLKLYPNFLTELHSQHMK